MTSIQKSLIVALGAAALIGSALPRSWAEATSSGGLYPNDAGPKEIDVSRYPPEMQKTYKIFTAKCSACHTIARPINSQFLELSPQELEKEKSAAPEAFSDPKLIQADDKIWNRYVKRMMSKPGCPVGSDGKRIWEFLVYDSKARKTGANLKAWTLHRRKLLEQFKKDHPEDYEKLFGKT